MISIPTLDTPRLRLRAYRREDFEAYAALWAEPAVVRFIGGTPLTREAAWIRFLRQIGLWHHLGFGFFALEDKATGALVGEAGFHDLRRTLYNGHPVVLMERPRSREARDGEPEPS